MAHTKKNTITTNHCTHRLYPQVDSTVDSTTSPTETNHRGHQRNKQHKPYNIKDTQNKQYTDIYTPALKTSKPTKNEHDSPN